VNEARLESQLFILFNVLKYLPQGQFFRGVGRVVFGLGLLSAGRAWGSVSVVAAGMSIVFGDKAEEIPIPDGKARG
jgi:hypothetical protein